MGLYTNSRRTKECRASRGTFDNRADPQGARAAAGAGATTSWQTFLRAHWSAIIGADFFATEVWTWRGLVTYYTVFVIDLASRRVQIVGSTPYPDERFMCQVGRTLTAADDGVLGGHHVLIGDRDAKWSAPVRARLRDAGIRVVQTPFKRRMRMPMPNGSCGRLRTSVSIE